ncbi:DoxX family protein [Microbispora sp. ATCC PTA-5024]|uniref:DoxX family protein n=1 Tax=Microbispora sp. ATCC PTA-5024 TaxID=316330 RepID=UPI0003DBCF7E|nr:DoxX family protein [Microbispora sp. ATCC PTA-5024]ETK36450.1 DoxX family protein [Microbispora sp. ATCC PTA-5024]
MNVAIWIIQVLLALVFLAGGAGKLAKSKEALAATPNMAWAEDFSPPVLKTIGALEVLAALGLVLPGLTGIAPVLTPLAAVGVVVLMIGAAATHARRKEWLPIAFNVVLLLLAAVVAWARFGPYAF